MSLHMPLRVSGAHKSIASPMPILCTRWQGINCRARPLYRRYPNPAWTFWRREDFCRYWTQRQRSSIP